MIAKLFYNVFIALYPLGVRVAAVFNDKARLWIEGRKQQHFDDVSGSPVWVHCASLGEFEQVRPLIEKIKTESPSTKILLSFFSPSGYQYRKNYAYADWVKYLPMDSKKHAKVFIEAVNPSLVIFVKYEYWFYYLNFISKQAIPLVLVSGIFRSDQPFFKWYGSLHRKMLSFFTYFFVQNEASQQLLKKLGFSNAAITGDTRFDRVVQIAEEAQSFSEVEEFLDGAEMVIVAGSTWPEDDKVLAHLANANPNFKFIIAPHNIDEARLAASMRLYERAVCYSKFAAQSADRNVLIIDNVGMLSSLYRYGKICYIGGGFGGDGVHNVLEAAVYGKPIIHGPSFQKYAEAVDLVNVGASYVVTTVLDVESTVFALIANEEQYNASATAAFSYVQQQKGASEQVFEWLYKNRLLTK